MAIRIPYIPATLLCAALAIAGCASGEQEPEPRQVAANSGENGGLIDGLLGSGSGGRRSGENITVNSYLWRASLDTISFLPLSTADPFGGVIITDWYSDPTTPTERFKATVYILDTRLRADALNVSIFRQEQVNGAWRDAATSPDTEIQIENAILTRARQLRLSSVGN